jgi:hypothetical protein
MPNGVTRTERDDLFVPSAAVGEVMGDLALPFPAAAGLALIGGQTKVLPKYSSPNATPDLMAMVNGTNSVITVTWSITPVYEDVELVVDIDDYYTWIPKGTKHENLAGSQLHVTATLQNKDGTATDKRATWMKYELIDTSREPGVCLNWPEIPGSRSSDLRFPIEQPQKVILDDGMLTGDDQTAQTVPGQYLQTRIYVACFDYGAWSTLRVTAKLEDGRVLVGHLRGNPSNVHITIPWRENGSFIAQAWKQGRPGADVADSSDVERTVGNTWDGDGFSLYEEYRGFFMNGEHCRFDPSLKELCVLDFVKGATLRGFRIFEAASHIKVKHEFRVGEVPEDRVVNRNRSYYSPKSSNEFQHALKVIKGVNPYLSQAVPVSTHYGRQLPKYSEHVEISPDIDMSANAKAGFDDKEGQNLAHEMAHACGVEHHGSGDRGYFSYTADKSVTPPRIIEQHYMDMAGNEIKNAPRVPVHVFLETGQELDATHPLIVRGLQPWLAVHDAGQHSGDASCMMRYDHTVAYVHPRRPADGRVFLINQREIPGFDFCDSRTGTLFNDPGRRPWPRYGNAAAGVGNCRSQLCVRDSAW